MPRNIMLPQEQENSSQLSVPSKGQSQKRSSTNSNFSDEDFMQDTKWRTNLLISEDCERVQRREQGYRKNTSFENKIINDHIKVMVESAWDVKFGKEDLRQCIKACQMLAKQEVIMFKEGMVQERVQSIIQENMYLTEQEKPEFMKLFTKNYDNYQILVKTISRLSCLNLLTDQLAFILLKVVQYISSRFEQKLRKQYQKFMQQQLLPKLTEVVMLITDHPNVKLINPEYFYNQNEKTFSFVIERWLYCAFAIKMGVYGNKYLEEEEGMDCEI